MIQKKTARPLAQELTLCGMLVAVAMVLSAVERLFPLQLVVPIPGVKLGLANVVTVFALCNLGLRATATIVCSRVLLTAILFGSVVSFFYSLLGGLCAMLVMWVLLHLTGRWLSLVGVSVAGAAAHNVGQIVAAILTLGTTDVVGYLPLLLLLSIPMGLVTGAINLVLPQGRIRGGSHGFFS